MSTDTKISVKAIDHVTLVVKDLDVSQQFYCDLLGMELLHTRPDFPFDGRWFKAGNQEVHLIVEHPDASLPGYRAGNDDPAAGLAHHFAFEVDDVFAATEVLKQNGIKIMGGPKNRGDDCMQTWFYDPDGHVVEVFHRP